MKKWIWREIAEVLGVLGVVGSLIFVALEIRENTRATRSSTIQDISRWSYDSGIVFVENADLREAWQAACDGTLNRDQRLLMLWAFSAFLRIQVNRFYQVELGTIDEATAFSIGGRGGLYRSPMFREYWPILKVPFEPAFQEYVESELLPLAGESCGELQ